MLSITLTNKSRSPVSIVTTHYAVLEIGLSIVRNDGSVVSASPQYPSELSRRSRSLDPGESYTMSGPLSEWGYHLAPGKYRLDVERASFKTGTHGLKASLLLTVD